MTSSPDSQTRPTRLNNVQVAGYFHDIADMMRIMGENRFKIIAYQNAARTLENLSQDINAIYAKGQLQELPDVGKAISDKISELIETGTFSLYKRLSEEIPAGVVEMMRVPDVGPKTAKRLWEELDVTSIEGMKTAAESGKIADLKGFGKKSQEKILKGIELLAKRQSDRTPIGTARPIALELMASLQDALPAGKLQKIDVAGSLRRWRETIGDLDLLAVGDDPGAVMATFRDLPQAVDVTLSGETKTSIILPNGMQVDLRVVEAKHWGAALIYFTGSKEHNVALREWSLKQGWSLNEYGLTAQGHPEIPDGEQRFFETEADLHSFLGLAYMPPELREGRGEVKAASQNALPDLVSLEQIQGELHGHTDWSDGTATLAEMAEAARQRGYRYWAVCDHSVGLGMVGGLDGERLAEQAKAIALLNQRYEEDGVDFRLLRGTEVEILSDGSLGLPDDVLAELDVVVASIHSGLRQDRETVTERALNAVRNSHVDILGHPTGRLIGRREGSEIDLEQVLQACAETGTIVEINAHPSRLDLSGVYAKRAVELGCRLAINSDAHAADGMAIMPYGVATARRGWLRPQDVVNTQALSELRKSLKDGKTD